MQIYALQPDLGKVEAAFSGLVSTTLTLENFNPESSTISQGRRFSSSEIEIVDRTDSVPLYKRSQTLRTPTSRAGTLFGATSALSGNQVLVSAFTGDRNQEGVYLYDTTTGDRLQSFLNPTPSKRNDRFGFAIAIEGDNVVISAPSDRHRSIASGTVYLFNAKTGERVRTFRNPTPESGDEFGSAIAISGNKLIVGTPADSTEVSNSGAAYLFDLTSGKLLQTFLNPTPDAGDLFGSAVAISGDRIVVGSYLDDAGAQDSGAAYLFSATDGALTQTFLNPTPALGDLFGNAVAISGEQILIGARADDTTGLNSGAAYLFEASSGKLAQTFLNPAPNAGDVFGVSVALSNQQILIGASADDQDASNSGSAYLFDAVSGRVLQTFTNPTPGVGDLFGNSVAIDGTQIVITAIGDDDFASNSGAAYLFELPFAIDDELKPIEAAVAQLNLSVE